MMCQSIPQGLIRHYRPLIEERINAFNAKQSQEGAQKVAAAARQS
jgi:hypothetical protein